MGFAMLIESTTTTEGHRCIGPVENSRLLLNVRADVFKEDVVRLFKKKKKYEDWDVVEVTPLNWRCQWQAISLKRNEIVAIF